MKRLRVFVLAALFLAAIVAAEEEPVNPFQAPRKRKDAVLPYGASYNIDYFQKALRKHLERAKDEGIEIRPAVLAEAERALA